jgi:hypothetical protein
MQNAKAQIALSVTVHQIAHLYHTRTIMITHHQPGAYEQSPDLSDN